MNNYNFDKEIDRRNTSCEKWDAQGGDFIPLWVADCDFRSPDPILQAITDRVRHGVFGYTDAAWELTTVVQNYYLKNYGYEIDPEWIVWVPSVMPGANLACRVAGGAIVYHTPMYPHIRRLHEEAQCDYYELPLQQINGRYTFDFKQLEQAYQPDMKAFVLCNPHNPVGRVYTQRELEGITRFCEKHDMLLISDEIHSQLLLEGTHIPAFTINEEAKMRSITLTSAAKTFNIPALPLAFAIIPNADLRARYRRLANGLFPPSNPLTIEAVKAAYTHCEHWRQALVDYLRDNRDYVEKRVASIPGITAVHSEATYLAWLDARACKLDDPWAFFREKAGVNFSDGRLFGYPGYLRINYGCPRRTLERAFDRMEQALRSV